MIRPLSRVPLVLSLALGVLSAEDQPTAGANLAPPPLGVPVPLGFSQPLPAPPLPATTAPAGTSLWSGSAALVVGEDDNVLLQPSNRPSSTNESSSVLGGELRLGLRPIATSDGRLDLSIDADHTAYPDVRRADLSRLGARIFGQHKIDTGLFGRLDPSLLVAVHRYWLDGSPAATSVMVTAMVTAVRQWWVGVATVGVVHLVYDDSTSANGDLVDASFRHLFLLRSSDVRRNIEVSLRAGAYLANAAADSYRSATGTLAGAWRFGGSKTEAGIIDASLRLSLELRSYGQTNGLNDGDGEQQSILRAGVQAAWWLSDSTRVGPYAVLSDRNSDVDASDYSRFQAGLRLESTF